MFRDFSTFRYRDEVLLGAVLFGFLVLLSTQVNTPEGTSLFKRIAYQAVAPFLRASDSAYHGVRRLVHDYAAFRGVVRENERLHERLLELETQQLKWEFTLHDNEALRALVDYRKASPLATMAARVVARDVRDPHQMLILSRGRRDGLEKDMAVLAPQGVVGRIAALSLRSAQVQLITDSRSALAGIHLPSGDQVLMTGQGERLLRMQYFSGEARVAPQDPVVTSGLEGIYPAGLHIGRVERVFEEDGKRVAQIRPAAPLQKTMNLLVVLERPQDAL
jgi:rod shape-determining protein MreC